MGARGVGRSVRLRLALLMVVALVGVARADDTGLSTPLTPSLRFGRAESQNGCIVGRAGLDRVDVAVHIEAERVRLDVRLTLDAMWGFVRVPIGLPRGARVTQLAATAGVGAVLADDGATFEHANVRLALTPEALGDGAVVELTVELPRSDALAIEAALPIERLVVRDDRATIATVDRIDAPLAIDLRAIPVDAPSPARPALLAAHASITADPLGPPPIRHEPRNRGPAHGLTIETAAVSPWREASSVARAIAFREPQLRRCYTQVAQGNPRLAGVAALHFSIRDDGGIDDISVDGSLDDADVRGCLARTVATLDLPPGEPVRVNYPIRFVPRVRGSDASR